eukprot:COSAG06_NODE_3124_length_5813_cov_2.862268_1_plen_136_part_10
MGEESHFRPIWRIDDGPVRGIGWEMCQAVMERSQQSVQQGFAPWIPTGSQLTSSCANESYHVATTYSTTEMLTPGDHTLWHGVVATTAHLAFYTGWIKCAPRLWVVTCLTAAESQANRAMRPSRRSQKPSTMSWKL